LRATGWLGIIAELVTTVVRAAASPQFHGLAESNAA
jgi:hypothetical protein